MLSNSIHSSGLCENHFFFFFLSWGGALSNKKLLRLGTVQTSDNGILSYKLLEAIGIQLDHPRRRGHNDDDGNMTGIESPSAAAAVLPYATNPMVHSIIFILVLDFAERFAFNGVAFTLPG